MSGIAAVAAPLLAAATVTVCGVIIQQPDSLRFPTAALAISAAAAAAFITLINTSIWASYWDSEPTEAHGGSGSPYLEAAARHETYRFWVGTTRLLYIVGVYTLWVGLGVAFFPKVITAKGLLPLFPVALAVLAELTLYRFAPKAMREPAGWVRKSQEAD